MRKITRKKINRIRALHKRGYSVRKIAAKLNCSPTTVQKYNVKDRNYEIPLSNLLPEENLIKKTYAPAPSQPNRESYYPQPTPQYPRVIEDPRRSRERYPKEAEYHRRREEDKRMENNRKFYQGTQEILDQLKMKHDSTQQENKRKNINIIIKQIRRSDESYKKFNANIQELEEERLKKLQEEQQLIDSIPRLIRVKLKEAQTHQKAQEDEIQKSEDQHKPIPVSLEQAEEYESTESDSSEILEGILLGGILGLCEGIDRYRRNVQEKNKVKNQQIPILRPVETNLSCRVKRAGRDLNPRMRICSPPHSHFVTRPLMLVMCRICGYMANI